MKSALLLSLGTLALCGDLHAQGADACDLAQVIAGVGLFDFDNTAATQDGAGNPLCLEFGTDQIDRDVWFAWTPASSGGYLVRTCNVAPIDTKIAIYDGSSCAASIMLDCNDDTCSLQSRVQADGLVGGSTYLIRIGSFPGAAGGAGQFEIVAVGAPANDACANATSIAGNGLFEFDNTFATTDGPPDPLCFQFGTSQVESDVWYRWICPADGGYRITTCDLTSVDTRIALYDGQDCTTSSVLDCNDDADGGACGLQSEVFGSNLVAGDAYLIRIGTFPGSPSGSGQFEVAPAMPPGPPPNDDCANAQALPDCGQFAFDNTLATTDGLSHGACSAFGANQIAHDVWYTFTATTSGTYEFSLCSTGSGVDTKIAVYADLGACPPGTPLDCDDDFACGVVTGPSRVTWTAAGGSTYLLRLGTFPGASGGSGLFDVAGCGSSVGTSYCATSVNSTGAAATISAAGSASISANDLVLIASHVPDVPGFGIFIAGPATARIPFFDGFLCLDPPGIQRINQLTAPVAGVVTQAIDYTGISTGTAALGVVAGSSYFYQHWMRDPVAAGSGANLSDGLDILHTP